MTMNDDTTELDAFISNMRNISRAKPAVSSEEAHDTAHDWAQHVTGGGDVGDDGYREAYRDAKTRIRQRFHVVRDER